MQHEKRNEIMRNVISKCFHVSYEHWEMCIANQSDLIDCFFFNFVFAFVKIDHLYISTHLRCYQISEEYMSLINFYKLIIIL